MSGKAVIYILVGSVYVQVMMGSVHLGQLTLVYLQYT